LLGFPDEDIDVEILYGTHLECWDREPWLRPTAKQITQHTLGWTG